MNLRLRAVAAARFAITCTTLVALLLAPVASSAQGASRIVRSIAIERASVFDSSEARFFGFRILNTLHANTRSYVIRREILQPVGEPYDSARASESERNLRALGIFRDVVLDTITADSGVVLRVRTYDAWTTTIGFGASSSASQLSWNVSASDINVLGTRTVGVLGYAKNPDRSSVVMGFDTPRALFNRVGVGASYVDRSDGSASAVSVRSPFLSLSSGSGWAIGRSSFDGRVLRYVEGLRVPGAALHRRATNLSGDAAIALRASSRGYVRAGLEAQLRRDDFAPETLQVELPRTVTAAAGPYIAIRAPRFLRTRNFQSIERVEDVELGAALRAGVLVAPTAWGYDRGGLGLAFSASAGHRVPSGFVRYRLDLDGLRAGGVVDSSTAVGSTTVVMQGGERHLLVMHAGAGSQRHPAPGAEFDLGLGDALRAYPAHAFTGDRYYVAAAEYRLLVWPRALGLVGIGVAGFVGRAGAWYSGSPRREGTEAGVGLRLASLRETGGVWRLDASRRQATPVLGGGWVVSLGRGFVFRPS